MRKKDVPAERRELVARLRKVRENMGYTQERFAELLGISYSAYKKIAGLENQITLEELRRLKQKLNISADYLLFGETKEFDEVWATVQNCDEEDKLRLFLHLYLYFTKFGDARFFEKECMEKYEDRMEQMVRLFCRSEDENRNDTEDTDR